MSNEHHHVVVLGATPKAGRYAHQALLMLQQKGYKITPVHPKIKTIEGLPVAHKVEAIKEPVDTLTLYVGPARLEPLIPALVRLNPRRVIFNPGTESPALQQALDQAGIAWEEACTLVLLRTGQF